jgi:hypothetical protein
VVGAGRVVAGAAVAIVVGAVVVGGVVVVDGGRVDTADVAADVRTVVGATTLVLADGWIAGTPEFDPQPLNVITAAAAKAARFVHRHALIRSPLELRKVREVVIGRRRPSGPNA